MKLIQYIHTKIIPYENDMSPGIGLDLRMRCNPKSHFVPSNIAAVASTVRLSHLGFPLPCSPDPSRRLLVRHGIDLNVGPLGTS